MPRRFFRGLTLVIVGLALGLLFCFLLDFAERLILRDVPQRAIWIAQSLAGKQQPEPFPADLEGVIPRALRTRDQAILHLLLKAAEMDEDDQYGARFQLAHFFLSRDCDVSVYYLKRHLEAVPDHTEARELLEQVSRDGCEDIESPFYGPPSGDWQWAPE